jgi:hypothetical protein
MKKLTGMNGDWTFPRLGGAGFIGGTAAIVAGAVVLGRFAGGHPLVAGATCMFGGGGRCILTPGGDGLVSVAVADLWIVTLGGGILSMSDT